MEHVGDQEIVPTVRLYVYVHAIRVWKIREKARFSGSRSFTVVNHIRAGTVHLHYLLSVNPALHHARPSMFQAGH